VNGRARESVWMPLAVLFVLWLGHLTIAYTAASLRCHNIGLGGELLSLPAYRVAMLGATALAAFVLALLLAGCLRRRVSGDPDAQLAGFMGVVLGSLFAAYLVWSVPHALTNTAVC
jgi:peptidoglycan biosynthesis protein MviN/MurJ (putative lipid II flippase)